jgi:hypothetical protein
MHRAVTPRRGRFCATPRGELDALAGQVFDLAALPEKQTHARCVTIAPARRRWTPLGVASMGGTGGWMVLVAGVGS